MTIANVTCEQTQCIPRTIIKSIKIKTVTIIGNVSIHLLLLLKLLLLLLYLFLDHYYDYNLHFYP